MFTGSCTARRKVKARKDTKEVDAAVMPISRAPGIWRKDLDDQQAGSDDDRTIGDVEGGPLILADIEEQEVHHTAVEQAVPEVSSALRRE